MLAQTTANVTIKLIDIDGRRADQESKFHLDKPSVNLALQYKDGAETENVNAYSDWLDAGRVLTTASYNGKGIITITGMSVDFSKPNRLYKLTVRISDTHPFEPHNPPPLGFLIKPCDLDPTVNEAVCRGSRRYAVRDDTRQLVDSGGENPEIRQQYVTTPGGITPVPTAPGGFDPTATITANAEQVLLGSPITFRVTTENYTPGGTTGLIFIPFFNDRELSGCQEITRSPQEFTLPSPQTTQGTFKAVVASVTDLSRRFCQGDASQRATLVEKVVAVQQANVPPPPPPPPATPTPTSPPPPCKKFVTIDTKKDVTKEVKSGKLDPKVQYECVEVPTAIGDIKIKPEEFVKSIFGLLLGVSGGIAVLLIIYAAYRLMTSQGNPERIQGAKETLTSAIVGLLFIIFSLVLLEAIGVDILRIPGFGR